MTKRKNLYLKIETKKVIPTEEELNQAVDKFLKRELVKNNNQALEHSIEELETLRQDIKEAKTIHNHQLRKIKNFPVLAAFIAQNIHGIKQAGQPILLKKESYDDLLKKSKISNVPYLHIWANSEVVLCTIHPISKELLQNALKNEQISADKYEELLNQLENSDAKSKIVEENLAQ